VHKTVFIGAFAVMGLECSFHRKINIEKFSDVVKGYLQKKATQRRKIIYINF